MAKKIQDFRKFNSSREEKTISNKKTTVGVDAHIDPKISVHKNARKRSTSTQKNVGKGPASARKIKEETKKNNSNKFVALFFVLLIIIGISVGCLFSPTFNLTKVTTEAGVNITMEEILNSFNIRKGTNVFKINYKEIESSIEKLPYIQSANANLELPSEIRIEYIERKPFALVKYLESYLVMDKHGYILEISRDKKFPNLPVIYNIGIDSYEIGNTLGDTAKTKYDNVVYLLENASQNNFAYSISEINYESISNVKMWVNEEDIEIIYGEIERNIIVDKLNYISEILAKVKGKGGRLDVSSSEYLEKTVFTERF